MKIWIIDKFKSKDANWIVKLLEEWLNQWLDIEFVPVEDIELIIDSNLNEKLFIKNQKVKLPQIVIPRMDNSYQIKSIIDFMENQGINIINSNRARLLANDKFLSLQKLATNRIPVPKTMLLKWIPNIEFIEKQFSYPIIIKKLDWHAWKWIIKVNNSQELEDILEMLEESFTRLSNNLIIQEYIWEKAWQDLRVFIVWWRIVWSMLRKWKEWDFKANFSWWGSVYPHVINETEEILALESANIIWLDIAGVDLLFDKDSWYKICEVNASPGWKWLEQATGVNIAWEIINYIKTRYNINT